MIKAIYVTGDTHGEFGRVFNFCKEFGTSLNDVLIILGDAGVNFSGGFRDEVTKRYIASMPITLFCIHGNHEQRPAAIPSYESMDWHGGKVYVEKEYPNILFGKDGEVFDFDGLKTIVIGGAYSVDKPLRLAYGYPWWEDEQPSEEIKRTVEKRLDACDWKIDVVLSHTTPLKYEPVEIFMSGIDQSKVDKSTEEWLECIEEKLNYGKWYCGHYHTEKIIDRLELMFRNFSVFCASDL